MKLIKIFSILFVVMFFTACPKTRTPMPPALRDKLIKSRTDQLTTLANNYDSAITTATEDSLGKAKVYRNELVHQSLLLIDDSYNNFENNLFVGRATSSILGDLTELGASAATGITNGARVKTILGIALTAFKGGRESINTNLFMRQTTQVIILKMRASRARILQRILQGLALPVADYPLGAALDDLINYLYAGSLNNGLLELAQDAGADAKSARATAAEIKIQPFLTEAQVVANGKVSDVREKLRDDLSSQDKKTADEAEKRIRTILGKLYTADEIAKAKTREDLLTMLQAKIAEANRTRNEALLKKIQDAFDSTP